MSGGFVKIYGSIVASSIWSESLATRVVWITMLAQADAEGFVEGSVGGLARLANVTRDECESALATLEKPDSDSKSPAHDGRRIEKVDRGWSILNYTVYRELRTRSQDEAARRKRDQRAREREAEGVTVTNVTDASASSSASASVDESEKGKDSIQERGESKTDAMIQRPGVVKLRDFMAANDFGRFRDLVEGFVRASRSPLAVISTLEMHLTGEMSHEKATALQLGLALQQYDATGEPTFKPIFFAGFVRKAKAMPERADRRRANAAEDRHLVEERRAAETRQQEERDRDTLAAFKRDHPARHEELLDVATAEIAKMGKMTDQMRRVLIHDKLVELVRREANNP